MKLNHVNLTVDDVPAARRFLERHFGMRPSGEGQRSFDVLFDDDDLVSRQHGAWTFSFTAPGGFAIEVLC
jgi:catechol 2,3-dioxygenase-like lactoylglutathione lyase family enzyme